MRSRARFLLAASCALLACSSAAGEPGRFDVAAVLSQDLAPYREVLRALEVDPGLRVTVLNLKGDVNEAAWVLRDIRSLKPDLVVTIGSLATEVVGAEIDEVPVVFCMTMGMPEGASVRANMTGVSLSVGPGRQFAALRQALPAARTVGVVYDPARSGALVGRALEGAAAQGLTLVAREVEDATEVPAALRLLADEVEALWLIPDSTSFTRESFEFVLRLSLEKRLPLLVFSEAYVKAGALLSVSPDYRRVGLQVARLVLRIRAGEPAGSIPPEEPDRPSLVVNRRTALNLDLDLPPELLKAADRMIE